MKRKIGINQQLMAVMIRPAAILIQSVFFGLFLVNGIGCYFLGSGCKTDKKNCCEEKYLVDHGLYVTD
jgi:hypothetical protein